MRKGLVRLQAIFLVDPCRPINTIDGVKQMPLCAYLPACFDVVQMLLLFLDHGDGCSYI